jgi:tetratricopeptide (TPR) repeat protein
MFRSRFPFRFLVPTLFLFSLAVPVFSDDAFDKLIDSKNYSEALTYAEKKIPTTNRDATVWVKLGVANLELGLTEKALACYLVASRMDAKNYNALLGSAKVYNSLNQPANAATSAKKALDLNFTAEASWEYARACIALNKPVDAKKALEKVTETDPANTAAVKELGIIYYNEKNYPKAIDLLKAANAKQPDGDLAMKIGAAYRETKNPDSALVYLKLAKDKKPTESEASFELAKIYFNTQQFEKAAAEFEAASSTKQLGALDYWAWGTALSKSNGNPDKIVKTFQLALDKFGPSKSKEALEAHAALGAYYLDKKNYQSAVGHYQAVYASDSTGKLVPDINSSLAFCYQGLDQIKKAIVHLERELIVNPQNVGAYAMLGDLYEKSGSPDKAKAVYEKMLSLNPNNPKIQMALGEYYLKAKKFQDALKYFQKSYTLERSAAAAQGMATAAFSLDQIDMARDAAESALHLDATLWDPRVVLSKIYMKDKNFKEAKEQYEFMVRKQPGSKEYWQQLAICYEQLNDPARLAEIDRKIISLEPKNIPSHVRLARYTLSQGNTKDAIDQYKELAALSPKDPEIFKNLYELSAKNANAA